MIQIRRANRTDLPVVADILGAAFDTDPVCFWATRRHGVMRPIYAVEGEHLYLPAGHTFVATDERGRILGAAMWTPPGHPPESVPAFLPILRTILRHGGLRSLLRFTVVGRKMLAGHPPLPHYYLHAIGVRPEAQGRGVGSALLRHVLARADQEGHPAYLENTNPRNTPLYERWGFRVRQEIQAGFGAPPFWWMDRVPHRPTPNGAPSASGSG